MRMMLPSLLISAAIAGPAIAASGDAAFSWGRPGVSYKTYRTDAIACAARGYFRDISDTSPAKAFVKASTRYDNRLTSGAQNGAETAIDLAQIVHGLRVERRMEEVEDILLGTVEDCLLSRGYVRYGLTDAQRHHLSRLKKGSPERHAYLHRLGSSPTILFRQADPSATSE